MARIYFLIVAILCSFPLSAQVASSCVPTAALSDLYDRDVADMALSRMYAISSPDTALIEIPAIHKDSVMRGLAAIFNTGSVIEADSIFRVYCVHALPHGYSRNEIQVYVDDSYPWVGHWAALHSVTGNTALDDFMALHGFTVKSFYSYSWAKVATISTTHTLNWKAFADSLELFAGVYQADPGLVVGSGNRITYTRGVTGIYTFFVGWGDCPAGCTGGKTWKYAVDDVCNVTLLSAIRAGVDEQDYTRPYCNMVGVAEVSKKALVKIYPNPAQDVLHIQDGGKGAHTYSICNMVGAVMSAGTFNIETTVDIGSLPLGMYMVSVQGRESEVIVAKFTKY